MFLPLLWQDSIEMTGSEVGDRGGGGKSGKDLEPGIRTRDAGSATALYDSALPTWLLAQTKLFYFVFFKYILTCY